MKVTLEWYSMFEQIYYLTRRLEMATRTMLWTSLKESSTSWHSHVLLDAVLLCVIDVYKITMNKPTFDTKKAW